MKQYVIDQLRPNDHQKLKAYLDAHFETGALPGIYKIFLIPELLDTIQAGHPECRPYVAVELEPNRISCELLVRSCIKMRCDCMGYVNHRQRDWLIDRFETILNELEIAL
ncbi:MAG: hypothetical protein AB1547_04770 [Thermodesulfobacteriota bacterium]